MKTYKNLYPRVYSFENLYRAYRAARKGKRKRVAVASFEFDLEGNLLDLQDELCTYTYRPGAYTNFYIYEPKRRLVSAAPFRDRVVHHALCRAIEPIWDAWPTGARFIDTSYACRVGKGTHQALDRCQAWMRQYAYAFHGDVVKYFPSIDHQILRRLLARRIADRQTMWLVDQILDSGAGIQAGERPPIYFAGDDLFAALRPKGLPIGNLTSQFWANVYLHELDMFVKHQLHCAAYLRYMDDFVLFCDDKAQLQAWKAAIRDFLAARLRLELHPRKSPVFPVGVGIDFCGFRIFATHRRLRRSSVRRFVRRFRRQRDAYERGELTFDEMNHSVRSWLAHAAHGDTWRLRARIFADYPIRRPRAGVPR
ncbi:MAG: group II intron reverse transcriptase domain-containing protein [Anaerolineae bacterium]|nr:group II intron reverse transcriptase domain-containing protein [Anaerolineae bacterium]